LVGGLLRVTLLNAERLAEIPHRATPREGEAARRATRSEASGRSTVDSRLSTVSWIGTPSLGAACSALSEAHACAAPGRGSGGRRRNAVEGRSLTHWIARLHNVSYLTGRSRTRSFPASPSSPTALRRSRKAWSRAIWRWPPKVRRRHRLPRRLQQVPNLEFYPRASHVCEAQRCS
jgi:hypothetical protein